VTIGDDSGKRSAPRVEPQGEDPAAPDRRPPHLESGPAALSLDAAPGFAFLADRELIIRFANREFRDAFGAAPGQPLDSVIGRPALIALSEALGAVSRGETVSFTETFEPTGARACRVTGRLAPHRRADGSVGGTLCLALEVAASPSTALVPLSNRENEALEQRERDLQRINDGLPALIGRLDTELRFRYMNAHYRRVIGEENARNAIGRTFAEVMGEATHEARQHYFERALQGEQVSFEATLQTLAGTRLLAHVYSPEIGSDGRVQGVFVFALDITKQRRAEEEVRRAARDIRILNDSVPLVIARLDRGLRFQYVNA
jgi:PAS domain S-box-containing protein